MRAWIKGNTLYFDKEGWALLVKHARTHHMSPKACAIAAIKRGIKQSEKIKKGVEA